MFEEMSHEWLQAYWWVVISFLGACMVMLLFVQGGQSLLRLVAKTDEDKHLVINSLGRKWELTFTTLVTFGGAFFASFPLFYSTSFSGAYWVWMLLLFSFVVQAVSYKFRTKSGNLLGQNVYEVFLMVNGVAAPLLIGVVLGTFFTGSMFEVNDYNLSRWMHPAGGIESMFNSTNLCLGITVFLLSRQLGGMYLINTVESVSIAASARNRMKKEAIPFVGFAVLALVLIGRLQGFAFDDQGVVFQESNKYLNNMMEMPAVLLMSLTGVALIVTSIVLSVFMKKDSAFWYNAAGTVLLVMSLFLVVGFNNTAYYPSTYNMQSSLTIHNSSSSHYTLVVMSYVSLFVPVVVAYIWVVWKAMNKKKLSEQEMRDEGHVY